MLNPKNILLVGLGIALGVAIAAALLLSRTPVVATAAPPAGHAPVETPEPPTAPLNLVGKLTTPASAFDGITRFPAWKSVPRGAQVFDNVPLQIDGMICLWGEGNADKLKIVFPERISDIAVNQKFETLYVYHGCFFKSPDGTPVCNVIFHYVDGSALTNQLVYGGDFIDWMTNPDDPNSSPTGPHSKIAWVGGQDRPLRLCLTAIDNPHPALEVATLDLVSCKSRTAPCIMAMTTGKAGLMK